MQERKSWIDHPAFITANRKIKGSLRKIAFDFGEAVKSGDHAEAARLVEDAKALKWDQFPFQIIRGGKTT